MLLLAAAAVGGDGGVRVAEEAELSALVVVAQADSAA
jgi:hypothetical protein